MKPGEGRHLPRSAVPTLQRGLATSRSQWDTFAKRGDGPRVQNVQGGKRTGKHSMERP